MATLKENEEELKRTLEEYFPTYDWSIGGVFHEQIIKPWAVNLSNRDTEIDTLKNNMSLFQVLNSDSPDEELVDLLLSNFNVTRKEGTRSTGFISVYFSGASSVAIPAGTIITCAGIQFSPTTTFIGALGLITEQDTTQVSYIKALEVNNTTRVMQIEVISKQPTDIVLSPGQVCTHNLSSTYIKKMETSSTFSGGSLPETTEDLIDRAKLGITAESATGKDNIRSLLTNSPYNVLDVQVFGFGDEVQIRDRHPVTGISSGGRSDAYVSTNPVIQKILIPLTATRVEGTQWTVTVPSSLYAGAYAVKSIRSGTNIIDTPIQHVLGYSSTNTRPYIKNEQEARYSRYQILSVYFFDENTEATVDTTKDYILEILYMPNIDELQTYIEDNEIQTAIGDILIKAFIPIEISIGVSVDYFSGVVPPDITSIKSEIAAAVNTQKAGKSSFPASDVVYAIKKLFPSANVKMPIRMHGTIYLPDGTIGHTSDNNNIEVPVEFEGVTAGNVKFFSSLDLIDVSLKEV
jgi:hypothetical protein